MAQAEVKRYAEVKFKRVPQGIQVNVRHEKVFEECLKVMGQGHTGYTHMSLTGGLIPTAQADLAQALGERKVYRLVGFDYPADKNIGVCAFLQGASEGNGIELIVPTARSKDQLRQTAKKIEEVYTKIVDLYLLPFELTVSVSFSGPVLTPKVDESRQGVLSDEDDRL